MLNFSVWNIQIHFKTITNIDITDEVSDIHIIEFINP